MRYILLFFLFLYGLTLPAQIGLGTLLPESSSALDISSITKGLLIPRIILSTDLNSNSPLTNPATGIIVFNTGPNQTQGFYFWSGSSWSLISTPSTNDVSSSGSSTDNAIARFNGISGKSIQNSSVILTDEGNITGVSNIITNGFRLGTNPETGLQLVSDASGNASWQGAPPIDVKYNDTLIVANANLLNFRGGINVRNSGSNEAAVTFFKTNVTRNLMQLSTSDDTDINTIAPVIIEWNTENYKDAATFIHSNSSDPGRIYVNRRGIYEINFMFSAINLTIKRQTVRAQLRKNGSLIFPHVTSYSFTYQYADNRISHVSSSFLIQLEANDYIELLCNRQTNDGELRLVPNENVFFIRLMRTL